MKFRVCKVSEVDVGSMKSFMVDGRELLFTNVEGSIFCMENMCPHRQARLSDGLLEGEQVICGHHGAEFNVKTGKVSFPMPIPDAKVFQVEVVGDEVFVHL